MLLRQNLTVAMNLLNHQTIYDLIIIYFIPGMVLALETEFSEALTELCKSIGAS